MWIESFNRDKPDIHIYEVPYIQARGYEHAKKLRCVRRSSDNVPVEFFDEVYRAIEVDIGDKHLIYSRRSERIDDKVISLLGLENIEFTFVKGQWQFYEIDRKELYYNIEYNDEHVGNVEIKNVWGIPNKGRNNIVYKDNYIANTIKALDKAYKVIFGSTEIELTDEVKASIIEAKKKVIFKPNELETYEKVRLKLIKSSKTLTDIPWKSLDYMRGTNVDSYEIIKSPLNEDKKSLLFKLRSIYAEFIYENIFGSKDFNEDKTIGYTVLFNEHGITTRTIAVTVVCEPRSKFIGINVSKYDDEATYITDISNYIDYGKASQSTDYYLKAIPTNYMYVVLNIILRKNLIELAEANVNELYGFKDIKKVKYIGEI